eukprot:6185301-Pleurochrysis_carterae.AAC.1
MESTSNSAHSRPADTRERQKTVYEDAPPRAMQLLHSESGRGACCGLVCRCCSWDDTEWEHLTRVGRVEAHSLARHCSKSLLMSSSSSPRPSSHTRCAARRRRACRMRRGLHGGMQRHAEACA